MAKEKKPPVKSDEELAREALRRQQIEAQIARASAEGDWRTVDRLSKLLPQ